MLSGMNGLKLFVSGQDTGKLTEILYTSPYRVTTQSRTTLCYNLNEDLPGLILIN